MTSFDPAATATALRAQDKAITRVVDRFGPPPKRRVIPPSRRFHVVATAILHQQLAGAAARAICGRIETLAAGELSADFILETDPDAIRACGVSANKLASLLDLAHHVTSKQVTFDKMGRMDDHAVIDQLVGIRGIGVWTAEMFLMSALGRPDVWPVGDFGVRAGWTTIFSLPDMIAPKALEVAGEVFRPHRTSLAWYCWQAADAAKRNDAT